VPLTLAVIATHFSGFDMGFEHCADLFSKPVERIGQRLEHVQSCFSRNASVETFEGF